MVLSPPMKCKSVVAYLHVVPPRQDSRVHISMGEKIQHATVVNKIDWAFFLIDQLILVVKLAVHTQNLLTSFLCLQSK